MDGWAETSMELGRVRGVGVIREEKVRDGVLWEEVVNYLPPACVDGVREPVDAGCWFRKKLF
ncbi:MAG: hypothetical protein D5R99_00970 [Methanocalculus sp. MSAO_Arc1]|uniref:hypothetical protein n=1 Tax=Methanocalculus sp. MSAO_Arc1 TaxID=2293854 RepID=UPI000FF70330|nr:hypothetical protein [Methanocalculus sp. MSAO_Arc1]RQD81807.1 MAG: hypothetical protein D5R99_00970 [Methanocalculus sp. MSAO_Arc1]